MTNPRLQSGQGRRSYLDLRHLKYEHRICLSITLMKLQNIIGQSTGEVKLGISLVSFSQLCHIDTFFISAPYRLLLLSKISFELFFLASPQFLDKIFTVCSGEAPILPRIL